ncbi:unnamed protein product [Peniophora sp. CBMAI 1063]|nr:unnamed protein product [Peniophora sp. CBMAI 1063]
MSSPALPIVLSVSRVAEKHARAACGTGSLDDALSAALVKTELEDFYRANAELSGPVAFSRLRAAVNALFTALTNARGATLSQFPLLWELLVVEQVFFTTYSHSPDLRLMQDFLDAKGHSEPSVEMESHADGFGNSGHGPSAALDLHTLGPLQWWLALDNPLTCRVLRRQDIYDSVADTLVEREVQALSPSPDPQPAPPLPSAIPLRATIASEISVASGSALYTGDNELGAGSIDDDLVIRRPKALPSPWLPPVGLVGEITWRIEDLNQLRQDLLNWRQNERIPDALIWEHPAMHGCAVDAAGQAVQYLVCPMR